MTSRATVPRPDNPLDLPLRAGILCGNTLNSIPGRHQDAAPRDCFLTPYECADMSIASTPPSNDVYAQLAKEQGISRGSYRAVALPQPLPGFVVKQSTMHGAPAGWRADASASVVNVDPDVAGGGFTVDFSKLNNVTAQQIVDDAGVRQATSFDDMRERAAAALRQFAASTNALQPEVAPQEIMTQPQPTPPVIPGFDRSANPVAAQVPSGWPSPPASAPPSVLLPAPAVGNGQPQPVQAAQFAAPTAPPATHVQRGDPQAKPSLFDRVASPAPSAHAAPVHRGVAPQPSFKVKFEVNNSAVDIEAWYHQIIRAEHILALCYDVRTTGIPRMTLRPTSENIAVHVEGSDSIYIVTDPAIRFVHNDEEVQVFFIKSEHPYNPTSGAPEQPPEAQ